MGRTALLVSAIGILSAIAQFFYPLLLILPGFFAYLGVAMGPVQMAVSMVISGSLVFWGCGIEVGAYILLMYIPAAIALAVMLKKKCSTLNTVVVVSGIMVLTLWITICLDQVLKGLPMYSGVTMVFNEMFKDMPQIFALAQQDVSATTELLKTYIPQIPVIVPGLIFIAGMIGGFFSMLLARALSVRAGAKLHPMRPFTKLRLPKGFLIGMLVLILIALVIEDSGTYGFDAVLNTFEFIAFAAFAIQGLGVILFLMRSRTAGGSGCLFISLILMLTLFAGSLLMVLLPVCIFMGLYEQLFRLRKRLDYGD